MKKDERFPSKWLKAGDLKGKAAVVTIDRAEMEVFKNDKGYEEDKLVVYFKNKKKGLICNQTNWDLISEVTGTDDDSAWPEHKIELYSRKVEMRGKQVDAIRVRAPTQAELPQSTKPLPPKPPAKPLAEEMDDEIPF